MEQTPAPAPAPPVEPKKKHGLAGRKPNEKQMEGLRKGMEAIKKKREEMAKLKEENMERIEKGLEPIAPPPPKPKIKIVPRRPDPEVIEVERKERVDKGKPRKIDPMVVIRQEFEQLKTTLQPAVVEKPVEKIVEKIVEKPVEKIVEKTKVLSGSELLNAIFFNK